MPESTPLLSLVLRSGGQTADHAYLCSADCAEPYLYLILTTEDRTLLDTLTDPATGYRVTITAEEREGVTD